MKWAEPELEGGGERLDVYVYFEMCTQVPLGLFHHSMVLNDFHSSKRGATLHEKNDTTVNFSVSCRRFEREGARL